jgi:excisionase family DNA binding protein
MPATTESRGAYRPAEAAAWLGVSRDTLDRMWQNGELLSFTVGRARFISAKELERFVSDREAAAR